MCLQTSGARTASESISVQQILTNAEVTPRPSAASSASAENIAASLFDTPHYSQLIELSNRSDDYFPINILISERNHHLSYFRAPVLRNDSTFSGHWHRSSCWHGAVPSRLMAVSTSGTVHTLQYSFRRRFMKISQSQRKLLLGDFPGWKHSR